MTKKQLMWIVAGLTGVVVAVTMLSAGAPPERVTLCHQPQDDPSSARTLTVAAPAVPGHLGHGDQLGACPVSPVTRSPR